VRNENGRRQQLAQRKVEELRYGRRLTRKKTCALLSEQHGEKKTNDQESRDSTQRWILGWKMNSHKLRPQLSLSASAELISRAGDAAGLHRTGRSDLLGGLTPASFSSFCFMAEDKAPQCTPSSALAANTGNNKRVSLANQNRDGLVVHALQGASHLLNAPSGSEDQTSQSRNI
jgi:hypothetical protein